MDCQACGAPPPGVGKPCEFCGTVGLAISAEASAVAGAGDETASDSDSIQDLFRDAGCNVADGMGSTQSEDGDSDVVVPGVGAGRCGSASSGASEGSQGSADVFDAETDSDAEYGAGTHSAAVAAGGRSGGVQQGSGRGQLQLATASASDSDSSVEIFCVEDGQRPAPVRATGQTRGGRLETVVASPSPRPPSPAPFTPLPHLPHFIPVKHLRLLSQPPEAGQRQLHSGAWTYVDYFGQCAPRGAGGGEGGGPDGGVSKVRLRGMIARRQAADDKAAAKPKAASKRRGRGRGKARSRRPSSSSSSSSRTRRTAPGTNSRAGARAAASTVRALPPPRARAVPPASGSSGRSSRLVHPTAPPSALFHAGDMVSWSQVPDSGGHGDFVAAAVQAGRGEGVGGVLAYEGRGAAVYSSGREF